jgi:hypothetical protein
VANEPTDAEIEAGLGTQPESRWQELWDAWAEVEAEPTHVAWAGGDQVGTTVVDGVERPVLQMPYALYSDSVERLRRAIGGLGIIVVFPWPDWEGMTRYRSGQGLADAPVADAARLATAVLRGERFCEGNIEAALDDGTLAAIIQRLRRWFDHERPLSS